MDIQEIILNKNGPIKVSGSQIDLKTSDGDVIDIGEKESVFLCRCGQSRNKPFCDGTHKQIDFGSE